MKRQFETEIESCWSSMYFIGTRQALKRPNANIAKLTFTLQSYLKITLKMMQEDQDTTFTFPCNLDYDNESLQIEEQFPIEIMKFASMIQLFTAALAVISQVSFLKWKEWKVHMTTMKITVWLMAVPLAKYIL